jgi:hypothetical protein
MVAVWSYNLSAFLSKYFKDGPPGAFLFGIVEMFPEDI